MNCGRTRLVANSLASTVSFLILGCGPKPYDIEHPTTLALPTASPQPQARLVSAALDHPAPPAGTPELDRAETAVAGHPNDVEANRTLAFTYYKLQAFAQATPAFRKLIDLVPDDSQAHLYLGYSQMASGDLDDAIATFQKVQGLKNVTPVEISTAYLEIGNCEWAMGKYDLAAAAFSRSIGANSRQGLASLGLGTYAATKGRVLQARDFFLDAVKDLPPGRDRAQAYACLGRLSEDNKDSTGARKFYKAAVALDPKNKWAVQRLSSLAKAPPRSTPVK